MSQADTQEATDTGLSDATDTSATEDSLDTGELEDDDTDLLEEVKSQPAETEEDEDESEDEEATESDDTESQESDDDAEESLEDDDEGTDEPDPNEATEEDKTESDAEERKRQNDDAAKRRIADREQQRQAAKQNSQLNFVQSGAQEAYDQALANGLSPQDAQLAANREASYRQTQVDSYNNRITLATNTVQTGIDKAVAAIPLFRTGSPAIKEELASALDDFEARFVMRDANGDITAVRGDVFQFLQDKAASIERIRADGAQKQISAKKNQKTRTLARPTRTPAKPKVDPDVQGFDEEANKY